MSFERDSVLFYYRLLWERNTMQFLFYLKRQKYIYIYILSDVVSSYPCATTFRLSRSDILHLSDCIFVCDYNYRSTAAADRYEALFVGWLPSNRYIVYVYVRVCIKGSSQISLAHKIRYGTVIIYSSFDWLGRAKPKPVEFVLKRNKRPSVKAFDEVGIGGRALERLILWKHSKVYVPASHPALPVRFRAHLMWFLTNKSIALLTIYRLNYSIESN